jgi:glycerate-2-kinase
MDQSAPDVPHFVIGSISVAAHAAIDAAEARGITPFGHGVYGENIEKVVQSLKATVRRRIRAGQERPFMIAIGGESTVKLPPNHGLGGRCQELAVAFANTVSRMEGAALLAAGTDGTDGPTDAAGGMVEPDSLVRARGAGFSARDTLERHDSYHFLDACGGLIKTGPTGSNVNDLTLFVLI